jgi:hypothetical protein
VVCTRICQNRSPNKQQERHCNTCRQKDEMKSSRAIFDYRYYDTACSRIEIQINFAWKLWMHNLKWAALNSKWKLKKSCWPFHIWPTGKWTGERSVTDKFDLYLRANQRHDRPPSRMCLASQNISQFSSQHVPAENNFFHFLSITYGGKYLEFVIFVF